MKLVPILKKQAKKQQKRSLKCDQCDRTFTKAAYLKYHSMLKHEHPCTACDRMFANRTAASRHMKGVHGEGDPGHECPTCKKVFGNGSAARPKCSTT